GVGRDGERDDVASFIGERAQFLAGRHVEDMEAVTDGQHEGLAVRREGCLADWQEIASEILVVAVLVGDLYAAGAERVFEEGLARGRVPYPQVEIIAPREKAFPVRAEAHCSVPALLAVSRQFVYFS